jgi:D-lactate dehydrogenase
MNLKEDLVQLAKVCLREVIVLETNCCGFAGDRVFSFPNLNSHRLLYIDEQTSETF